MQRIFQFMMAAALMLGTGFSALAFHPKEGYKDGKIILKSGLELKGKVLPLAKHNEHGTAFRNEQGKVSIIAHDQIAKVTFGEQELIAKTIQVNGKSVQAYTEIVEEGNAALWKAYFYDEKAQGKNSTVTTFQNSWMIYSPVNGLTVLGEKPSAKKVAEALQHPEIAADTKGKHLLNESELRAVVSTFNTALTLLESGNNEKNRYSAVLFI